MISNGKDSLFDHIDIDVPPGVTVPAPETIGSGAYVGTATINVLGWTNVPQPVPAQNETVTIKHRVPMGPVEALNARIQGLIHGAKGFRSLPGFINVVRFVCSRPAILIGDREVFGSALQVAKNRTRPAMSHPAPNSIYQIVGSDIRLVELPGTLGQMNSDAS